MMPRSAQYKTERPAAPGGKRQLQPISCAAGMDLHLVPASGMGLGPPRTCLLLDPEWDLLNDHLLLTAREREVVNGILQGKSEAGVAVALGISTNTVHTHLGRVYKKLSVRSAAGLILRVFAAYVHIFRPAKVTSEG